jgi:hypothetical protein
MLRNITACGIKLNIDTIENSYDILKEAWTRKRGNIPGTHVATITQSFEPVNRMMTYHLRKVDDVLPNELTKGG